ncbi:GDP-L-fucose synthase family protein [Winogradskyella sediminis]|uniref:GDP-L-fucose synthase n=1 Tax=Winogradskyella sediminis TaxID=1382466 RepID=A0A1H1PUZ5_9FLAO|nr:GDP-L-fucose synthase [Winogradskyella sediminis]SDS14954.1 GDP-L-fucose synthase [Winogradskyella sediminis]
MTNHQSPVTSNEQRITTHESRIYVAGHRGMVGSAVWRALEAKGYTNLIGKTSSELDLRNQEAVAEFFKLEQPDIVINAAAKVGGILANNEYPYPFLMENLQIQNNLIDTAHHMGVSKFVFLGSSCIYPKLAPQPIKEEYLLTDSLEPTNEWYAIAKIAGVKACEAIRKQYGKDFVSLMPTNLYGPFDNFDLKSSHVLPAMLRKFHEAKATNAPVELWGSGTPMREFLHVDDMAQAVVFAVEHVLPEHLYNVGTGTDVTIKALAETIQDIVGHKGELLWDSKKPDGTPRKLMDSSKLESLGWKSTIALNEGIAKTYQWFLANCNHLKEVKN